MHEESRWQAVLARDAAHDGAFVYGVISTGIYCRPSCPARRPRRKHVRFFPTAGEAERSGLRPCKRCRPNENEPTCRTTAPPWVTELCRYIEAHCDEHLSREHLARHAGTSVSGLQRGFAAALAITPREYAAACRTRRLKWSLRNAASVTDAVFEAGFGSTSRVYEGAAAHLGMTPGQYRQGGVGAAISHATVDTPLGVLMIAATDRGLCFVQFGESEEALLGALRTEYPRAVLEPTLAERARPPFADWITALEEYLRGRRIALDMPVDVRATAFQRQVWDYLRAIPYGELRSYGDIARDLGRPKAVRAVGRAIACNRVGLVIPCHRVIRGDGALGGYRWGAERKQALIARERAARDGRSSSDQA